MSENNDTTNPPLKRCTKCNRSFPATAEYFYNCKQYKDGLRPFCKECCGSSFGVKYLRNPAKDGFKLCRECRQNLPATIGYFTKSALYKDGWYSVCKVCAGFAREYGIHQKNAPKAKDGFKFCTACDNELPATLEYFPPDTKGKYGLYAHCRACQNKTTALQRQNPEYQENQRQWRAEYEKRPEIVERRRLYNQRPDQKARRLVNANEWRKRNRERHNEQTRLRILNSPNQRQRRIEYSRRYNPLWRNSEHGRAVRRVHYQKRRAAEKSLPHDLTAQEWESCLAYFDHSCAVCGKRADFWTVIAQDHWTPVVKGGGTTKANIIPLCHARKGAPFGHKSCNLMKGAKDPNKWLIEQFGDKEAKKILKRIQDYFDTL